MHYLITGHTGFKGAWLTVLLDSLGHQVSGLALDPEPGSLFDQSRVSGLLTHDLRVDVRDSTAVVQGLTEVQPEVVIHMAAQPLVRYSYTHPRETFETNVMGTFNVLQAAQAIASIKAQVIVTTDKVYRNVGSSAGYVESDPLGGQDPYSASKSMADILTSSWRDSFATGPIGIARAGNVIGGGDVCQGRLLPDLLRSFASGELAAIRHPQAVRPWQHVLDCLAGYYKLSLQLVSGHAVGEWNFGPDPKDAVEVGRIASIAAELWGSTAAWVKVPADDLHEAQLLTLNSSKAHAELGWSNQLGHADAVAWTVEWSKQVLGGEDPLTATRAQVKAFQGLTDHA